MKNLSVKQLRLIRNILIFGGIAIASIIWFFIPSVLSSKTGDFPNVPSGTKLIMLPTLILPLFAFLDGRKTSDAHTLNVDEQEYRELELTIARDQILYATIEDVIVIAIMLVAMFL